MGGPGEEDFISQRKDLDFILSVTGELPSGVT